MLPVLLDPIDDLVRYTKDSSELIQLETAFSTEPIDDQVVRFTSQSSNGSRILDFALFSDETPVTRANFLKYVTDGDYLNSIIHRSMPGFVIQGGGFYDSDATSNYNIVEIPTDAPIINEFSISNTYGTISMAKLSGDPDSATSQWFISIGENSDNLDNQNGGFTVFGRVTKSTLANAESFGNGTDFPIWNAGGAFASLPLIASFDNSAPLVETDFILFTSVSLEPIAAGDAGESTTLIYSVVGNSNPDIVSAEIIGSQLQLSYVTDTPGSSTLTIQATDSVGNNVEDSFTVSTQPLTYDRWRQSQFTGGDLADDTISGPTADSNQDGLTNLEIYVHNLSVSETHVSPVQFSSTALGDETFPTFTFPIRNNLTDITITLEESIDIGLTDPWAAIPHVEISREPNGNIDTVSLRSTIANSGAKHFYRLKFTRAD